MRCAWNSLAALWLGLAASAATPAQDMKWLSGNWDVTYEDAILGRVKGQARVIVRLDGWVDIQYLVTDPRDRKVHELAPFHIYQRGDVLEMELPMGGPSGATTLEGTAASAAAPAARVLVVPVGSDFQATLNEARTRARVGTDASVANPRLRLVRKGERLEGEWVVQRDSTSGFRGTRVGTRSGNEMRGKEVWETSFMLIEEARRGEWTPAAKGAPSSGTMKLAIIGRNLPNSQERQGEVAFSYAALKPDLKFKQAYAAATLTLPVAIDRDAVPGPKTFTVTDPQTTQRGLGQWTFDWPPLGTEKAYYARLSKEDHYEPTAMLYQGEYFYIEAQAAPADSGNHRIYALESDASAPMFFHMTRDPKAPLRFRAGPFMLLAPGDLAPGGSVETPTIELDKDNVVRPSAKEPFVVRATVGSRMRAAPATALPGERTGKALAEVKEDELGDGRYPRALRQAREFRKTHPDRSRYEVTSFQALEALAAVGRAIPEALVPGQIPKPPRASDIVRRTHVSEADHAALIVLHDEVSRQVVATKRLHARRMSAAELRVYGAALTESQKRHVDEPLFAYEVPTPDGPLGLGGAVHFLNMQRWFGTDQAKWNEHYERVVAIASSKYVDALALAHARLESTDTSKPEELMRVVKPAYSHVAGSLVQTLVRRSPDWGGASWRAKWVPDDPGRAAVRGIADLIGAIASDEHMARQNWMYVGLIATGLAGGGMVALSVGAAGMVFAIQAVAAAINLVQFGADVAKLSSAYDDRQVSRDLVPLLGRDQYVAANDAYWGQLGSTGMTGLGVLADVASFAGAVKLSGGGADPPPQAMQSAVAQAMEKGVENLPPAARGAYAVALDNAVKKLGKEGVASLTPLERNAIRAAFPSGIPDDAARALKIPSGDPNFAVRAPETTGGTTTVLNTMSMPPSGVAGASKSGTTILDTITPPPSGVAAPSKPGTTILDTINPPPSGRISSSSVAPSDSKTIMPPPDLAPPRPASGAPQPPNPAWREHFGEVEKTARTGNTEARKRLRSLGEAAREYEVLTKPQRAIADEAAAIWQKVRAADPKLAQLDTGEALHYFNYFSRRTPSSKFAKRDVLPEELVAEFIDKRTGTKASAEQLARAANISVDNAEAAIFEARARFGPPGPPPAPAAPARAASAPSSAPSDSRAARAARAAAVREQIMNDPRRVQIAEDLKKMGMPAEVAEVAAIVPAARPGLTREGAAATAMQNGIPAERVMREMRLPRDQLQPMLDDYLRRFNILPNAAERQRALARYFGDPPLAGAVAQPPASIPPPPPRPASMPRGLARPAASSQQARAEVEKALKSMGAGDKEVKALPIDEAIARSGARPQEVAAGLARNLDIDSRTAAKALGKNEREIAGMLDNYEAGMRPHVSPRERAADVAGRMRHDGFTEPYGNLLQARQARVDAALRDVGIGGGDPALTARGLDQESAIVGEAVARGVPADVVQARRGLTRERLERHVDDYVANGEGILDPAQHAQRKTQLLSRPPTQTSGSTVRLPPRVIAAEHELADALENLGIPRAVAESRADKLANLAAADAHEAIVVGAWQSRIAPAKVQSQFGLTNEQMARAMDHYLANYVGMTDPAARARHIADNFFGAHGQPVGADAVRRMVSAPETAAPPLRAVSIANPPGSLPPPPPPPRPLPVQPAGDLTARFGPAKPPGMGLRLEERLPGGGVRRNPSVREVDVGKPLLIEPGPKYLWLIDERGALWLANERFVLDANGRPILNALGEPGRLGHATMIGGGRARIAGELRYIEGHGWVLDNVSGRYSVLNRDMRFEHLQNAAGLFERSGLRVRIDYHDPG